MLEIWKGGAGDPFETIDLNENRQYIHVRLNNIVRTYKDGAM